MPLKDDIAVILHKHRTNCGLSQEKLAAKADISARYYQSIEAAQQTPSIEILFKITEALGVEYDAVLAPVWTQWKKSPKDEAP